MSAKAARKSTAESTVPLVRQPNGGALKAGGTPGNKGGTGRPPDEFKAAIKVLVDEALKRGYVLKVIRNPNHPQFMRAVEWATDRLHGKVPQGVALQNPDGTALIPLGAIRELLAEDEDA